MHHATTSAKRYRRANFPTRCTAYCKCNALCLCSCTMQTHSDGETQLTTPQACEILGIDRATLTRWVDREVIAPAFKFPGKTGGYLFNRVDVERLAAQRAEQAGATA